MKRDFPFFIAFVLALCLHFAAGFALRQGGLFAAAPLAPRQPPPPVTLRFVEVPPNATTIPEGPRTTNLSDANRKAGPLKPNGPQRVVVQQPSIRPGPRTPTPGAGRRAAAPSPVPGPPPQQQQPADRASASNEPKGADIKATPKLSQSLEELDRYLKKGRESSSSSSSGGGGGLGGDGGNLPTGDPGSGVFFDTQGYDLGPWVNRVVEIVRSNWLIPVAAELGMKGVVSVSFKVARDGSIRDLQMISSSAVPSFDQAAVSALQSSSPLPALPADFPRDLLPGVFRFYYNTPVPHAAQ